MDIVRVVHVVYIVYVGTSDFTRSLLVFSGPSGAGKSTLLKRLFADFPNTFGFSVSRTIRKWQIHSSVHVKFLFADTTRQPRTGETDGVEYNFVNEETFRSLVSERAFLEHANFSGNWYGTSYAAIQRVQAAGRLCILDVDLAGVKSVKTHFSGMRDGAEASLAVRYIFVRPADKTQLEKRLRERGSETEESLARRLSRVDADLEYAAQEGNYDLHLVNDDFERAYDQLVSFVFALTDDACIA